jgi:hypothetical protein
MTRKQKILVALIGACLVGLWIVALKTVFPVSASFSLSKNGVKWQLGIGKFGPKRERMSRAEQYMEERLAYRGAQAEENRYEEDEAEESWEAAQALASAREAEAYAWRAKAQAEADAWETEEKARQAEESAFDWSKYDAILGPSPEKTKPEPK